MNKKKQINRVIAKKTMKISSIMPVSKQDKVKKLYIDNSSSITRDFNKMFETSQNKYIPERYKSYDEIINQLRLRYNGLSEVGNAMVKLIIDIRANYISGNGIVIDTDRKKEQKWIDEFMGYNNFETIFFKQAVINGELEGKVLLYLSPNKVGGRHEIELKKIIYGNTKYKVNTSPEDYEIYNSVTVYSKDKNIELSPEEFVYVKLSGTDDYVNETIPRIGMIMHLIDGVDFASRDFRVVNSKYSSMSIYFETDDTNKASDLVSAMKKSGWQPGQSLAGPAKAYYIEPQGTGLNNLNKEIINNVQQISGISGVSPQLLGWAEIFRNKATPESMSEMQYSTTMLERSFWKIKIHELIKKAMAMHNKLNKDNLNVDGFEVSIPQTTLQGLDLLKDIYLPMNSAGLISDRYVVNKLPDTDYESQKDQIEKEKKEEVSVKEEIPFKETEIPLVEDKKANVSNNVSNILKVK